MSSLRYFTYRIHVVCFLTVSMKCFVRFIYEIFVFLAHICLLTASSLELTIIGEHLSIYFSFLVLEERGVKPQLEIKIDLTFLGTSIEWQTRLAFRAPPLVL